MNQLSELVVLKQILGEPDLNSVYHCTIDADTSVYLMANSEVKLHVVVHYVMREPVRKMMITSIGKLITLNFAYIGETFKWRKYGSRINFNPANFVALKESIINEVVIEEVISAFGAFSYHIRKNAISSNVDPDIAFRSLIEIHGIKEDEIERRDGSPHVWLTIGGKKVLFVDTLNYLFV